jgi:pimeloyl-ACP methyl ester carboxylesterase
MKPVLLMIPGLLNDERVWADVAARLRDVAEVRIARVSGAASIDEMAADAWALVGDVPAATPVVPCGFSMGGYIAIAMLARPARRAAAVALIDTSSRPEAPENVPMREKLMAALERDFPKTVESLVALNFHPDNLKNTALLDEFRRMAARVGAATAVRQLRAIVGRADHRDVLATLDLPALVL